ncbi:MAG: MBL fold metallo-hydrolase [Pseudomonadota bacterium]
MYILNRRRFIELAAGSAAATYFATQSTAALGSGHQSADVFTADEFGALVDSVVVVGEEKMLLIDAQLTVPNAQRLVQTLAATGKDLETVFITHAHPDHFLGLPIILEAFPGANVVAHATVQPAIAAAAAPTRDAIAGLFPEGAIADGVVVPELLDGDSLTLEGERFDIIGPLHGDTDLITAVHMPQLDTVVANDLVYTDTHLWTAENTTPERIEMWRQGLAALEDLGASTVIPGHRTEDSANDLSAIAHTRSYLDQWEAALADTTTAEELKEAMVEQVGNLPGEFFLDRGVAAARG